MKQHLFKIQPLLPFYILIGENGFSQAIFLTRKYHYQTAILDILDGRELNQGTIPNNELKADLKAIIFLNIDFRIHTQRLKAIVNKEYFEYIPIGSNQIKQLIRPAILICTNTEYENVPWEIFPDVRPGKIGFLDCRL